MNAPPIPKNETERIEAVHRYGILDSPPEQIFDDIAHLAALICQTPIALISFVDTQRQWIKSANGASHKEISRHHSICAYTISANEDVKIIPDVAHDERFKDNPFILSEPSMRFYAAATLISKDGFALGTLSVLDSKPRELTVEQLNALRALRRQVITALDLRYEHTRLTRVLAEHEQQTQKLREAQEEYRRLVDTAQDMIFRTDSQGYITYFNDVIVQILGYQKTELANRYFADFVKPEFRENVISLYELQLKNKKPNTYFEVPILTKNGELLWIGQNVQTIIIDDAVVGFQAVARNITERKQWEELREKLILELEKALYNAKTLGGLLPICAACKKIRDDQGYWNQVEAYISEHSEVTFTHGICPECMEKLYSGYMKKK